MANSSAPGQPVYEDGVVRWFAVLSVVYGIVGMLVGLALALGVQTYSLLMP